MYVLQLNSNNIKHQSNIFELLIFYSENYQLTITSNLAKISISRPSWSTIGKADTLRSTNFFNANMIDVSSDTVSIFSKVPIFRSPRV